MTNEKSLLNIEKIKSFFDGYSGDQIYFHFKTPTEFEVFRYPLYKLENHLFHLDHHIINNLPMGRIFIDGGEVIIRYSDSNYSYVANLTTGEFTLRDINAPIDMDEARTEYKKLVGQFK